VYLALQDLVDVEVFQDAKRVIDALRRGDCSEALAWCAENRKALKKSKVRTMHVNLLTCLLHCMSIINNFPYPAPFIVG
jgi:hypothetical protein